MSDNLQKMLNVFKLISQVKSVKTRNALLKDLSRNKNLRRALKEITTNVVKKNIPLTQADKKRLRKFQNLIYDLSKTKSDRKTKKLFCQSGGFLPYLIPIVASILPSLINGT